MGKGVTNGVVPSGANLNVLVDDMTWFSMEIIE